jgi:hypothetical protein
MTTRAQSSCQSSFLAGSVQQKQRELLRSVHHLSNVWQEEVQENSILTAVLNLQMCHKSVAFTVKHVSAATILVAR